MLRRVAIHLGRGGLENADLETHGQPQHVDGAVHAGLGRLHGVELVVDRRRGAGEVIDLVHLCVQGPGDVVTHEFGHRVVEQVHDVLPPGGEEIVHAKNLVPPGKQSLAEVRPDESRTAGDKHAFHDFTSLLGGMCACTNPSFLSKSPSGVEIAFFDIRCSEFLIPETYLKLI